MVSRAFKFKAPQIKPSGEKRVTCRWELYLNGGRYNNNKQQKELWATLSEINMIFSYNCVIFLITLCSLSLPTAFHIKLMNSARENMMRS